MDVELHGARIDNDRNKVTYDSPLRALPDGCFVKIEGSAYLVWGDALLLWTPEGYTKTCGRPEVLTVTVLTPEPVVGCFRQGYRPEIHVMAQK
jgi:hypothetical protein